MFEELDIAVGDKVYKCISWFPGVYTDKSESGEGTVTMIARDKDGISIRVSWPSGIAKWYLPTNLVTSKKVIRGLEI
jgi:hypothetical protein